MAYFVALFVVLVIAASLYSRYLAGKRRDSLQQLARSLPGIAFTPERDYSLDERYPFLEKLCQGDDRYAFNILSGWYRNHPVQVFDYHYETSSIDSDGDRKTSEHFFSFFILHFNQSFPELLISREGWGSKILQFMGFDDIDFESAEFSRQFLVKSPDKKFAYDICHARMIEYLLENDDMNVEIERHCLTLFFANRLEAEQIRRNLDRLVALRELFPRYLTSE